MSLNEGDNRIKFYREEAFIETERTYKEGSVYTSVCWLLSHVQLFVTP